MRELLADAGEDDKRKAEADGGSEREEDGLAEAGEVRLSRRTLVDELLQLGKLSVVYFRRAKGRKMPSAAWSGGRNRFIAISMNWTSDAMTRMNASVWI